jgi:hypothetical protein
MEKFIKHIWKYITSPLYRTYLHLYDEQSMLDRVYNEQQEMKEYESKRMFNPPTQL